MLREFGIAAEAVDFTEPDQVIQLGRAPNRIDILTGLSGVNVEECFATKITAKLSELPVYVLAKELLLRNKRATGRPQDLVDAALLEEEPAPGDL